MLTKTLPVFVTISFLITLTCYRAVSFQIRGGRKEKKNSVEIISQAPRFVCKPKVFYFAGLPNLRLGDSNNCEISIYILNPADSETDVSCLKNSYSMASKSSRKGDV